MAKIQKLERYKFDNYEYRSLESVKTEVENRLGKWIDDLSYNLPPNVAFSSRQRLALLEHIEATHERLAFLLNITFEIEGGESASNYEQNILDL